MDRGDGGEKVVMSPPNQVSEPLMGLGPRTTLAGGRRKDRGESNLGCMPTGISRFTESPIMSEMWLGGVSILGVKMGVKKCCPIFVWIYRCQVVNRTLHMNHT